MRRNFTQIKEAAGEEWEELVAEFRDKFAEFAASEEGKRQSDERAAREKRQLEIRAQRRKEEVTKRTELMDQLRELRMNDLPRAGFWHRRTAWDEEVAECHKELKKLSAWMKEMDGGGLDRGREGRTLHPWEKPLGPSLREIVEQDYATQAARLDTLEEQANTALRKSVCLRCPQEVSYLRGPRGVRLLRERLHRKSVYLRRAWREAPTRVLRKVARGC